jgi:hypothetical protein
MHLHKCLTVQSKVKTIIRHFPEFEDMKLYFLYNETLNNSISM